MNALDLPVFVARQEPEPANDDHGTPAEMPLGLKLMLAASMAVWTAVALVLAYWRGWLS